jgi:acylphosphatase
MSLVAVAEQLGLKGWVRNCSDGSVETVIQGKAEAVEDLLAWAHQGPPHARVQQVLSSEVDAEDSSSFAGFHVRADG